MIGAISPLPMAAHPSVDVKPARDDGHCLDQRLLTGLTRHYRSEMVFDRRDSRQRSWRATCAAVGLSTGLLLPVACTAKPDNYDQQACTEIQHLARLKGNHTEDILKVMERLESDRVRVAVRQYLDDRGPETLQAIDDTCNATG